MKKVFFLFDAVVLIFISCLPAQAKTDLFSLHNKPNSTFSNPTDHFRSVATGDWGATATWESSPDGSSWTAADQTPSSLANTISIRNTHTVTVSSAQNMDQVIIESGGILLHTGGVLVINDGTGDDVVVQSGGEFILSFANNAPMFSPLTATANINTNGILRVTAGGMTGGGTGVNANNYIYQNASVLELNTGFSTDAVIYFPNVDAVTIPIFRVTATVLVGASNLTIFNGVFEAVGGTTVTFQNVGSKTFRNGITGDGNVNGSTSGKFIINGTTASLGGAGLLTIPNCGPVCGMDIGASTTITMTSDKTLTGRINLLANALVILGTYNLTMADGSINGGSPTSHIVTNSTGKLVMNNIGVFPDMAVFPVGANTTTVTPMVIYTGWGLNYGVRVENGINPPIAIPAQAVNRTWFVTPTGGTPGTVGTNFFYYPGDGNAGFNYTGNVELGHHVIVWNVIQTNLMPVGSSVYQVTTSVSSFNNNTEAPLVLGNLGAILAADNSIQLAAQKQNDKTILSWTVNNPSAVERFTAERSVDGRTYNTLIELPPTDLGLTDMQPLPGLNYYRIMMKDKNGKITYSNIAVILNAQKGYELISITPNPVVNGNFKLNISAAQKTQMEILVTDMQGRLMQKQMLNLAAGFNAIPVNVTDLAKGTYLVHSNTADGRSGVLRFVIQ